jgi:hypothetical protein
VTDRYGVEVLTPSGGIVVVTIAAPTYLLTIERESLVTIRDEAHLLHVTGFILFDGRTPKFGFPDGWATCLDRTCLDRNSHFYWNLNNFGVVPVIG